MPDRSISLPLAMVFCLVLNGCGSAPEVKVSTPRLSAARDTAVAWESELGGSVGFALVDSEGGLLASYRGDQRFAMCSTFKALLVAAVLDRVEDWSASLEDRIEVRDDDLVSWSPRVERVVSRAQEGAAATMSLRGLCSAAVEVSDNAATNVLLDYLGGPPALTEFLREHGDPVTRLDRVEPELNANAPGDERDTTTPTAMARSLARLTISSDDNPGRTQLRQWMIDCETGGQRIRAGVPWSWQVGDKTGTRSLAPKAIGDIAFLTSPAGQSFVLVVYSDSADAEVAAVDAAMARIAEVCVAGLAGRVGVGEEGR